MPIAFERSSRGNTSVMMDSVAGSTRAAATPCTPRVTINVSASGARAAPTEAAPNVLIPITSKRRRPNRSPSVPSINNRPASMRMYPSTTHCSVDVVARKSRAMEGSAVFTTVLSTMIMAKLSDITPSTHHRLAYGFGAPTRCRHCPLLHSTSRLTIPRGGLRTPLAVAQRSCLKS